MFNLNFRSLNSFLDLYLLILTLQHNHTEGDFFLLKIIFPFILPGVVGPQIAA